MIDVLGPGLGRAQALPGTFGSALQRGGWHHGFDGHRGFGSWRQGVHERAVRLAGAERALAVKEAGLAAEDEYQSRTGDEQHRAVHRAAALIHRDAERLHTQAAATQQLHADLHR
jgi:hypothetical protein